MALSVNGVTTSVTNTSYAATEATKVDEAKAEEKKAEETVQPKQTETYKPDMDKINKMKSEMGSNISAFKKMVYSLAKQQGGIWENAFGMLDIDEITQEEAQAAIADDGYWGVEQTAGRILEFAQALSGGDPSKIELLRDAVKAGFGAAENVWGGKLPDISQRTYERVMKGFDDWAKEASGTSEEVTAE